MVEIIEKEESGPIVDRIIFPATAEQKKMIDELKESTPWDINAMFRQFADQIINEAKRKFGGSNPKAG